MAHRSLENLKRLAGTMVVMVLVTTLILVVLEGLSSLFLTTYDLATAENDPSSAEYDPFLGWNIKPNLNIPDFYGSGGLVATNSQGFRNDVEFAARPGEGVLRIVCSGDSFTFGAGVSNGETWCDHLQKDNLESIESINMGVSGYSVGQAMLRYEDRAPHFEHSVHIFAFITADIWRTPQRTHHGFGRPTLQLRNSELVVENVPVPRISNTIARSSAKVGNELRMVEFFGRALRRLFGSGKELSVPDKISAIEPMIEKLFARVYEEAINNGAQPVFVLLPDISLLRGANESENWLASIMHEQGYMFVNMAEEIRRVTEDQALSYFIPVGLPGQTHLNRSGNRWAGKVLNKELSEFGVLTLELPAQTASDAL